MNTVEIEIAVNKCAFTVINSLAFPDNIWKKIRNVGALSKMDDNNPLAQKHLLAIMLPFGAIQSKMNFNEPSFPWCNIAIIGVTVIKILANKFMISFIGSNEKEFLSLIDGGVVNNETADIKSKILFLTNEA